MMNEACAVDADGRVVPALNVNGTTGRCVSSSVIPARRYLSGFGRRMLHKDTDEKADRSAVRLQPQTHTLIHDLDPTATPPPMSLFLVALFILCWESREVERTATLQDSNHAHECRECGEAQRWICSDVRKISRGAGHQREVTRFVLCVSDQVGERLHGVVGPLPCIGQRASRGAMGRAARSS